MVKHALIRTLSDVAGYLMKPSTKNVVVLAGAGISTPSGLPDFRTNESGLYDSVRDRFNLPDPSLIFDIHYFRHNPEPFFKIAQSLYPGEYDPNVCHWFVRLLQEKNKLLRMYTQNIDGLENLAGIQSDLLVEAHGSFANATCQGCRDKFKAEDIREDIFAGKVPKCKKCRHVIKPNVVFFGEMLPRRFMLHSIDLPRADLVVVMGTSLEVQPFASLVDWVSTSTPRLLINKTAVGPFVDYPRDNDVILTGDLAENVNQLVEACGWTEDLKKLSTLRKTS